MRTAPDQTIEDILKIVEDRYGALLKSNLVGIAISDGDETIYRVNDKFLSILGYTRADFEAGRITWSSITPPIYDRLDEVKLNELYETAVTGTFEKEYLQKNGQSVPVMVGAEMMSYNPALNISFVIDVSKQKRAEKDKADVIATVGHELKTPLAVLRVEAELLAREIKNGISPKKLLAELKEFDEQIAHMDRILSDILTFTRPQTKVHTSIPVEFDVVTSMKKVISDIRLVSDRKIMLDQADKNCIILGNESEVREVFMNLISNALKYSPDNTRVKVSVFKDGDSIRAEVQDWGRGVSKTDQKKIFQKSYQVRHAEQYHESSSRGIGLYLCKEIMRKHDGKIEVKSELGHGSTFSCVFKALDKHPQ
ncbi:MAG TPA: PAS domain-containing sensor histidine kinase [Candidatus Paceibacterota bacterium]